MRLDALGLGQRDGQHAVRERRGDLICLDLARQADAALIRAAAALLDQVARVLGLLDADLTVDGEDVLLDLDVELVAGYARHERRDHIRLIGLVHVQRHAQRAVPASEEAARRDPALVQQLLHRIRQLERVGEGLETSQRSCHRSSPPFRYRMSWYTWIDSTGVLARCQQSVRDRLEPEV